jgi:hypothetical protein
MFGLDDLTNQNSSDEMTVSYLMLSLMQISMQAKILHWQTDFDTEHRHFGMFYDEFGAQMDNLIEVIAGKYGKDKLSFGQAAISVYDYGMARQAFFELVDEALIDCFCQIFDKERDSEIFNLADEIVALKNKVQYLLQLK